MTLWIFSANTSPSAPPNTVKSWAEHEDLAAVDRAPAGDHAVGERTGVLDAEAVGAVAGEHVELDERAGIEQQVDALARGELAALVLALDRRRAPGVQRLLAQLGELREPLLDRVGHRCGARHGSSATAAQARHDTAGPAAAETGRQPGAGVSLFLDELDERAERALGVHERDGRAAAPRARGLVDHADDRPP